MYSALRYLGVVTTVVVLADAVCSAQFPDRYKDRLEPALKEVLQSEKIVGLAVGIVEDGHLSYTHEFGTMTLADGNKPITPHTLFHMASITKTFVATSILQLVEQGKIDLNAPLTTYLPYFRLRDPRYKLITVHQMLSHVSGMPDVEYKDYHWDKPEYDDGALERYTRSLVDKELLWAPGSKFHYSNMAFECLGDLVAKFQERPLKRMSRKTF